MQAHHINFENPFRPGAGHIPPYLAGRTSEQDEIRRMLRQKIILENTILTGLRGVGKTVLLETFKPIAREYGWLWAGNDLSESASVTENNIAIRLLADIALVTSSLVVNETSLPQLGYERPDKVFKHHLSFDIIKGYYDKVPGLISDKLKATLEMVWSLLSGNQISGIVFAYDEAQNLEDHSARNEYPLSLLLEVFQSLQRKSIPFMLILTGLPTLFPKLVDARTYSERMFHMMFLKQLNYADSREAIVRPTESAKSLLQFSDETVDKIIKLSGGYPYFIQFICKEVYELWMSQIHSGQIPSVPEEEITRKLDNDFFYSRWANATDRQRDLLLLVSSLESCDDEFTVNEVVLSSKKKGGRLFSASQINQMFSHLSEAGLIYKNRHGKYSLAVPLLSRFLRRQVKEQTPLLG